MWAHPVIFRSASGPPRGLGVDLGAGLGRNAPVLRLPAVRAPVLVFPAALTCLVVVSLGYWLVPTARGATDTPDLLPLRALAGWDANWYLGIAREGYWYHPGQQSPVAFFPAYPMVIRALTWVGVNRWVAGPLISMLCGIAALFVFARWAETVTGQPLRQDKADSSSGFTRAGWATVMLIAYPFAFYLYGVVYSDSLFLLAVCSAFLAVEKDRPGLAALFGMVATVARPVAPAVVLGLLVRSLERARASQRGVRLRDWLPALAGLGLLGWMTFLQLQLGDALAFAHVQAAPGWDQGPGWHTWLKVTWFEVLFPQSAPLVALRLGGHALVTVVALALVWPTRRVLGLGYFVYVAIAVGLPALSSKDFMGLGRYCIAAFPLFLTAATLLERFPRARRWYVLASAGWLVGLAFGFGAGGYIS